jgi:phosphate-selective porin
MMRVKLLTLPLIAATWFATDARAAPTDAQVQELRALLQSIAAQNQSQQTLIESLQRQIADLQASAMAVRPSTAAAAVTEPPEPPDVPVVPAPAVPAPSLAPVDAGFGKVKFDGLLQAWFQSGDRGLRDSFRIRRAEMKFIGDISRDVHWTVMIDPAKSLGLSTTSSTVAGQTVITSVAPTQSTRVLQDAFVTLNVNSHANLNVGQFKIPLSLEGLQSSAGLDTERALFASDRVRGGTYGDVRDVGAMLYGPLTRQLDYSIGVFNGSGESQNELDRNDQKSLAARLVFRPAQIPGLQLGTSGVWAGTQRADRPRRDRLGFDVLYAHGPLTLKGEYMTGEDGLIKRQGYYAHFAYHLSAQWETIFRVDSWDPDTSIDSTAANADERDYVAGVNYLLAGSRAKLQFNYLLKTYANELAPDQKLAVMKVQTSW